MGIVFQALRFARVCLEESFLWAHSRQTFGKKLIEHPVIRAKIAEMARQARSGRLAARVAALRSAEQCPTTLSYRCPSASACFVHALTS